MLNQEIPSGCLLNIGIAIFLFIFLGMTLPPGVALGLFVLYIIGYIVYQCVQDNKKLAVQRKQEEEQKKIIEEQEDKFSKQKEELLAKIEKWEKDGVLAIAVKDKVLNQYNDVYFIGEDFYLVSQKTHKATKGTLLFVNKEVCFLSNSIVRNIPYSQTLQVQIGMFEIRFSSKKYNSPLSFFCHAENPYLARIEVCEAYAKWHLLNGFESKDFMDTLTCVLNLPMEDAKQLVVHKED